ncbi:AraC family transcriptional regulator ligand-binding domain-containing protein [Streptomyces sp. NPDC050528]|uniref:AraC family transcriptional regulator ligand-binding domain-containing protein n=1 Tax=Streptomyces sp. NPDC050528 TaxID=3365623 RepID=UPI003787BAAE
MSAPLESEAYGAPTRSVAIHHVRAALRGARRHGVDIASLLEVASIPTELLDVPLARVSPQQFARLTQAVWQALDDELQGLGPHPLKVGTFAMMCHAVVHCSPDLRTAINRSSTFYGLFPGGSRFQLEEGAGELGSRRRRSSSTSPASTTSTTTSPSPPPSSPTVSRAG